MANIQAMQEDLEAEKIDLEEKADIAAEKTAFEFKVRQVQVLEQAAAALQEQLEADEAQAAFNKEEQERLEAEAVLK